MSFTIDASKLDRLSKYHIVFFQPNGPIKYPVQQVQEGNNLTITVETPSGSNIMILKDDVELKPSDHVKIVPITPTTKGIVLTKAKLDDEGKYAVLVDGREQPIMILEVTPKPIVKQEMQLPKTEFSEKDTLTITCQFDTAPDESFIFLHNNQPIVPDSRITTTVDGNKYTIIVKDLRPEEDEGIYTLKSEHLILDTPSITIIPQPKQFEKLITDQDEVIHIDEAVSSIIEEKVVEQVEYTIEYS